MNKFIIIVITIYLLYYLGNILFDVFLKKESNLLKEETEEFSFSEFSKNLENRTTEVGIEDVEKLNTLDKKYSETVTSSKFKTILFGDRFPFCYLADDYGLKYYAAFVGCSAESEASFETVIFLAKKVDELGLGSVLTIENSNGKIARTVIENTSKKNQKILKMDSLQSVNQNDIKGGKNYLGTMTENLSVLKEALN